MADITREQLAAALDGFTLWVTPEEGQDTRYTFSGRVSNAPSAAQGLIDRIAARHAPTCEQPCGWCQERKAADPELTAVARILAELDGLEGGDDSILRSSAAQRVLTYVLDRHGYAIAHADE